MFREKPFEIKSLCARFHVPFYLCKILLQQKIFWLFHFCAQKKRQMAAWSDNASAALPLSRNEITKFSYSEIFSPNNEILFSGEKIWVLFEIYKMLVLPRIFKILGLATNRNWPKQWTIHDAASFRKLVAFAKYQPLAEWLKLSY